jgi:hypothetical protein
MAERRERLQYHTEGIHGVFQLAEVIIKFILITELNCSNVSHGKDSERLDYIREDG